MPRASGKTTLLIKESARTGKPIIAPTNYSAKYIAEQAMEMGLKIPEPISANQFDCLMGRYNHVDGFLIDELDAVLANIFGKPIGKATYTIDKITCTPEQIVIKKPEEIQPDNFYEMLDEVEKLIGSIDERLVELNNQIGKKEKTMSKFKVGDVVKVKPVDEMWKSDIMAKSLEKYACTQHRVSGICIVCKTTLYVLDDCDEVYFDEIMLEDRTYTKDDIFNINVIVPDKVVEIEFYDGKEKMVCHEDDTFDLRKCCFIAIAKHLYKREYTQEGIEYMATQLTYQKKYVKIVDKALKDYKKKEKEKVERIRKEEEEKIIRARQSLKRRKQKERRAQRHREVLIDVFADSINEAKARRKRCKE